MDQSLQILSRQERLENWTARIMACRSSGMTIRAWCQENQVPEKSYYYWQRQLFDTLTKQKEVSQQSAFAEITPERSQITGTVAVTVCASGMEAAIHNGADPTTVEVVLRILKSC